MAKESLAEKLARKSFESPLTQRSWTVHMQVFGPILEPAFQNNYQARVHLTAALNHISRRDLAQGVPKLKQLQKYCETDADKAAYLFFLGLCCEISGDREQMLQLYTYANEYEHGFYLPYLKVGKFYLEHHIYERAEQNYQAAIGCLSGKEPSEQERLILGSAYVNLASCRMMMHRYEEAETAMAAAKEQNPDVPGAAAVEAGLEALRGDTARAEACLDRVKTQMPDAYNEVKASVERILARKDPLFFPVEVEQDKITAFWTWFAGYSPRLKQLLEQEEYETALEPVGSHLLETFPFLEEIPDVALGKNAAGYVLELQDLYAVGIADAYEKLLKNCPEEIREAWQFAVVHERVP